MAEGELRDKGDKSEKTDKSGRNEKRDRDQEATGRISAGALLREARLAAGLDSARLATDLRISVQAFEALETAQYHLLPGDPYVRALLSSLARQLHLDPQVVIKTYLQEMGVSPVQGQVAPYQDKGESLSSSHRQILVGLMILLLVGFFFVLRQLNRPHPPIAATAPIDSTAQHFDDSLDQDSALESHSLTPESTRDSLALVTVEGRRDSLNLRNAAIAVSLAATKTDTLKTSVKPDSTPKTKVVPKDTSAVKSVGGAHVAQIQALGDSVWIKIMREGKPDEVQFLQPGKSIQINHTDTIRIAMSKKMAVDLILDGKVVHPNRKRFKLYGQYLKPY